MKKYFIASDIHSYYTLWMKALEENGFDINNEDHIIVVLGDLLDRGEESLQCLHFVNNLPKERKILIYGNHEDLMDEAICRRYFQQHDIHNCTHKTVEQVTGLVIDKDVDENQALLAMKSNTDWNEYISSCVDYYELENNIFVHGWIPFYIDYSNGFDLKYREDWRKATILDWVDARWANGMKAWLYGIKEQCKTIWCGHYHASWGHCNIHNEGKEFLDKVETFYIDPETGKMEPHEDFTPFIDDGIVAMDSCAAYTGFINVKVLEI